MQGVYFAASSYTFFLHTPGLGSPDEFSILSAAALVLYEVNLATSILVTVVVSFVLIPESMKSSSSANIDALRRLPALMMHNANIAFGAACLQVMTFAHHTG